MVEIHHVPHSDPPPPSGRVIYAHPDSAGVDRGQHGWPVGEGDSADVGREEVADEAVFDDYDDVAGGGGAEQGEETGDEGHCIWDDGVFGEVLELEVGWKRRGLWITM